MSEKVFALLVRLYPAAFRQRYEEEVLRLYRERLRDERGLFPRLRLTWDLTVDAVMGVSRAWRDSLSETTTTSVVSNVSGFPSFHLLTREPLKPGTVALGCVLSAVALAAFGVVMRLPAPDRFSNSRGVLSPVEAVLERLNRVVAAPTNSGTGGQDDVTKVSGELARSQVKKEPSSQPEAGAQAPLTAQQRDEVVRGVAENISAHYFDRQKAQKLADSLRVLNGQGSYAKIVNEHLLAERLTTDVRSATGDRHLNVVYSARGNPIAALAPPSAAEFERYRSMLVRENCSIERTEILPGNIGYLKLNRFPDLDVCGTMLHKSMSQIDKANTVIFDLRDNEGGFPAAVADMAAPLFNRTVAWYNPRAAQSATTLMPAARSALSNKPVYILTSSRTLSAAEQFTYNLKMLKRATVVGETTGGGGHTGTYYRVDEHFGIGIPETKITNPYGGPDWDGVGVEPDVKVKAADALEAAKKMAARQTGR